MPTVTTHPPLPTNPGILRDHYLPAEPHGTTVTFGRAVIARIDAVSAAVHANIAAIDEADRHAAAAICDAAAAGDEFGDLVLDTILEEADPAERAALEHRLTQLQRARSLASDRLATAERTDPVHVEWKQRCDRIRHEWQQVGGNTPEEHYANLVAFVERHR